MTYRLFARSLSAAIAEGEDLSIVGVLRVVTDLGSSAHLEIVAYVAALGPFRFYCPSVDLEAVGYARRVSWRGAVAVTVAVGVTVAVSVIAYYFHLKDLCRRFGGQPDESLVALVAEENRSADEQHAEDNRDHGGDHAADYFSRTEKHSASE